MPIEFSTCLEQDILFARWSGVVEISEFLENYAVYLSDAYYKPGRPELVDLRELVDFAGAFLAFKSAVAAVNQTGAGSTHHTHTVIFAPNPNVFGLARMYQQLADLAGGIRVEVFDNEAEALAALSLPYETVEELLAAESFRPSRPRDDGVTALSS